MIVFSKEYESIAKRAEPIIFPNWFLYSYKHNFKIFKIKKQDLKHENQNQV
jgi:hypothetical protein